MRLNLVTYRGQQGGTLRHMLAHYRDLVDDIFVIVKRTGPDDPLAREAEEITREFGCGVYRSVDVGHWDPAAQTELYNETLAERPDEWWIISDPDELHLYFGDVRRIVEECEAHGWSFVGGHFLDRVGPAGTLPEIDGSDLWTRFPLAGVFRSHITGDPNWKVCIAKGSIRLFPGQHQLLRQEGLEGYPVRRGLVQVHHFKWDHTVVERHRETHATLRSTIAPLDEACRQAYGNMYDYLTDHGERIDHTDPRFRFAECPAPSFAAYPHWREIVEENADHRFDEEWPDEAKLAAWAEALERSKRSAGPTP